MPKWRNFVKSGHTDSNFSTSRQKCFITSVPELERGEDGSELGQEGDGQQNRVDGVQDGLLSATYNNTEQAAIKYSIGYSKCGFRPV